MAALDELFRTMASTLTRALCGTGTLSKRTTAYDPVAGTESSSTLTSVVPCTPPEPFETIRIDNSLILASDLRVCVPAADCKINDVEAIPDPAGWTFAVAGKTYGVFRILPTYSGDQAALLELQLRN
jgi:hypothetical protein